MSRKKDSLSPKILKYCPTCGLVFCLPRPRSYLCPSHVVEAEKDDGRVGHLVLGWIDSRPRSPWPIPEAVDVVSDGLSNTIHECENPAGRHPPRIQHMTVAEVKKVCARSLLIPVER